MSLMDMLDVSQIMEGATQVTFSIKAVPAEFGVGVRLIIANDCC